MKLIFRICARICRICDLVGYWQGCPKLIGFYHDIMLIFLDRGVRFIAGCILRYGNWDNFHRNFRGISELEDY